MQLVPIHPLLVHLPLGLAMLLPFIVIGALWLQRNGRFSWRSWGPVLALHAVLAVSVFIAVRAGEREEERVEQIVYEQPLETHERAGERFWIASGVVLGLALLPAVAWTPRSRQQLATLTLGGNIILVALALYAGKTGGALVYEHGAANAYIPNAGQAVASLAGSTELEMDDD